MDIYGGSTANGTPLVQWTSNGGLNQQWSFTPTGDGYYKFSPGTNSASSLDVNGWSTAENYGIQEYTYAGQANQQWSVTPAN